MSGFAPKLVRVATADGRSFQLLEPLTYTCANGQQIVIPAGATSDGASTPRAIWCELPPFGAYWQAALLHDYLYRATARAKQECDTLFREAMLASGVEAGIADFLFTGVAVGGWKAFYESRRPTVHAAVSVAASILRKFP